MTPLDRYLDLIHQTLRVGIAGRPATPQTPGVASMDAGLVAVAAAIDSDRDADHRRRTQSLLAVRATDKPIDGLGHSRAGYRGLLLHSALRAFRLDRDTEPKEHPARSPLDAWSDFARGPVDELANRDALPASDGPSIVEAAWLALALGSVPKVREASRAAFARIAALQQASGTFLARVASDNPEPAWYHELQLLHAVASHHFRERGDASRDAMLRSARYVAAEVQPDHASSQPWGLHALLQVPEGVYLADMMLHSAGVQQPSTMDAVSLLLLADAYVCLRPLQSAL